MLVQARLLDRALPPRGPLYGVPIGVNDIIDTFDMPTEMGSPIYRGYRPPADAACIALLRRAGAVILGKTATCEFAGMAPSATANPHNPATIRLAVRRAARWRRSATTWCRRRSVHRLAVRCCGRRPFAGFSATSRPTTPSTKPASGLPPKSIDTIGWLARSIDDIELLSAVLVHSPPRLPRCSWILRPGSGSAALELWDSAQPETKAAVEGAAAHPWQAHGDSDP